MKNLKVCTMLIAMIIQFNGISFSQQRKANETERFVSVVKETEHSIKNSPSRDSILENKIRELRLSGKNSEAEAIQVSMFEKQGVRKDNCEIIQVQPFKANYFDNENDNAGSSNITVVDSTLSWANHYTVSEQVGPNNGRIWNIFFTGLNEDTIKILYSDDNGINWNQFACYLFAYPDLDVSDCIDAEIAISAYTNDKMLFIVFTCGAYMTDQRVGVIRIDVGNHPGLCSQQLFYFGGSLYLHNACVTSDNATFSYMPYIHLTALEYIPAYDLSIIKYGAIINTFDVNAPIYYSSSYLMQMYGGYPWSIDLCAFTNLGTDYIFVVEKSNYPLAKDLIVIQFSVYNALSGGGGLWNILGDGNHNLINPKVSADGSNLMIVCGYHFDAADYDIKYYTSSSGISGINTTGYVDNSIMYESFPQITSQWNAGGKFFCCYQKEYTGGYRSIYFSSSTSNGWNGAINKMISTDEIDTLWTKAALPVRTRDNECLVTWKNYIGYYKNIFSVRGCSGNFMVTKSLNLNLFIEGFYRPGLNKMSINDTVKVFLRKLTAPYNLIDSAAVLLGMNGCTTARFTNAENGVNYFAIVKHRNSIETWSKQSGIRFIDDRASFDFTLSNGQAFGANQKQVDQTPIAYAIFSGDLNHDGVIDGTDAARVDNDAYHFVTGFVLTDVNADGVIDGSDAVIVDNNAFNFVGRIIP